MSARRVAVLLCSAAVAVPVSWAQTPPAPAGAQVTNSVESGPRTEPVVASGQVPDEATRVAVIGALRQTYGAVNVVDKLEVLSSLGVPANWSANIQKLLTPSLQQIRRGQLQIEGTQVVVQGEVGSEALRQQVVADMARVLNPTYTIKNNLRVLASEQIMVDAALGNRIIEFETGSATLTAKGRGVLDELLPTLGKLTNKNLTVIGHTDNVGRHASNVALSKARAESVKGYLVNQGIDPATMVTSGVGPDQPVASNDSDAGRARNRRIEFRVGRNSGT